MRRQQPEDPLCRIPQASARGNKLRSWASLVAMADPWPPAQLEAHEMIAVDGMVSSGCPSCTDALIIAPFVAAMLVALLALGVGVGRWSYRRGLTRTGNLV